MSTTLPPHDPLQCHPFLWALSRLYHLPLATIAARAPLSKVTLASASKGMKCTPLVNARLRNLLQLEHAKLHTTPSPTIMRAPEITERFETHRQDVLSLTLWILDHFFRAKIKPPAQTELSSELLAAIAGGARRRDVMDQLRPRHSSQAIRKCARRIGVRHVQRDGWEWWLPPPDVRALPPLPTPPPTYVEPRTLHDRKVRVALERFLAESGDLTIRGELWRSCAQVRDIEHHILNVLGHSRTSLYRAARESCVRRHVEGFGPSKITYWALRPAPSAPDTRKPK